MSIAHVAATGTIGEPLFGLRGDQQERGARARAEADVVVDCTRMGLDGNRVCNHHATLFLSGGLNG